MYKLLISEKKQVQQLDPDKPKDVIFTTIVDTNNIVFGEVSVSIITNGREAMFEFSKITQVIYEVTGIIDVYIILLFKFHKVKIDVIKNFASVSKEKLKEAGLIV